MKILMVSSTFPYPPSRSGTEVRTFNLLKYLKRNHSIALATQRSEGTTEADIEALGHWVDEMKIFPMQGEATSSSKFGNLMGKAQRFWESVATATPPNILHRYSPQMQAWIDDRITRGEFAAMTCEHSANAIYARPELRNYTRTVVNVHSSVYWGTVNYLKMNASENAPRDFLYLPTLYRYEKQYCNAIDRIVVTTPDDEEFLHRFNADARIEIIANGVDLELFPYRTEDPGGHRLIFVGAMDFQHNIDAVRFFALEVLPPLRQRYPDAEFIVAGNRPTAEIQALGEHPGVVVTGKVPSMVEYLHRSTVCVVPLRTGFGIKNKTLEAMAAGVPVVGSDRGLEGLEVDGEPLRALRANTVEEYITAIARLFENPELRADIAKNARILIEKEFSWESAGERYERVLLGEN
ncbi:glycosyltransferase family 4 protein [Oscillatoria sp. FACHB-1406]|uniref:glycosyltransferase family 4 protein n=1 Tax=Oscillatoria sp. FACHB-1406 TaxID=2692846 RepID=UPI00168566FB|nr:glycosyltransferase family 4 protein [Oscillatoria sp. FACHB-1406]MBD2578294.1 glycosyltransferase [Oscillatoria sp. FACHB-1406]